MIMNIIVIKWVSNFICSKYKDSVTTVNCPDANYILTQLKGLTSGAGILPLPFSKWEDTEVSEFVSLSVK